MKKFLFNFMSISIVIGLLSACNFTSSEAEGDDTEANDQVLNLISEDDISSLDPAVAHDSISNIAIFNTRESLYSLDKDHEPTLTGASNHEESDDGLVHTFEIRENEWSNGDPVTADDFEYAWKRAFEETSFHLHAFETAQILNAKEIMEGDKDPEDLGVEAVDENTLVVTLSEPNPLLEKHLTSTGFMPVNQSFVESEGDKFGTEFDKVLSNGPFKLEEWAHDQSWTYEKNTDYWDSDNVTMEEINVNVVKEESAAVNLYDTDKVDLIEVTSSNVDKYESSPEFNAQETAGIKMLRFNQNNEALANENIRRALDMGWDKQELVDVILKNGSKPMNYLVPELAKKDSGETFRSLNGDFTGTIEEAQEYFEKGLEEIDKDSIELSVLTADEDEFRSTAEYLQSQWEENLDGLTIKIEVQPLQQRVELEKEIDYDISISSAGTATTDPSNYLRMFTTGDSFNRMDYSDDKYDKLFEDAANELDEDKRYELLLEAEQILFDDAAIGPMYQNATATVRKPYVKGVVLHPTIPQYSYKWAYIEE